MAARGKVQFDERRRPHGSLRSVECEPRWSVIGFRRINCPALFQLWPINACEVASGHVSAFARVSTFIHLPCQQTCSCHLRIISFDLFINFPLKPMDPRPGVHRVHLSHRNNNWRTRPADPKSVSRTSKICFDPPLRVMRRCHISSTRHLLKRRSTSPTMLAEDGREEEEEELSFPLESARCFTLRLRTF